MRAGADGLCGRFGLTPESRGTGESAPALTTPCGLIVCVVRDDALLGRRPALLVEVTLPSPTALNRTHQPVRTARKPAATLNTLTLHTWMLSPVRRPTLDVDPIPVPITPIPGRRTMALTRQQTTSQMHMTVSRKLLKPKPLRAARTPLLTHRLNSHHSASARRGQRLFRESHQVRCLFFDGPPPL